MYNHIINHLLFCRPWAKDVTMAHDSYFCTKYAGVAYPFLSQRVAGVGNFVGAVMSNQDSITGGIPFESEFECPTQCRPKAHKNWTYC